MTPYEAYMVGRATVIVLGDSERTEQIHLVEELTSRGRLRSFLRATADDPAASELLADRPELSSDQVDYDVLRALPADTLGGCYVRHLDGAGLSADSQASETTHVDDPVIAYLVRRFRQTHDVWHALTGLGVEGHEEVILHAFSWGQLRLPVSAMVVFFGTIKHILLERRWGVLRKGLWEAYRNGRKAVPLLPVYWEQMWEQPIADVRARLNLAPCTRAYVDG